MEEGKRTKRKRKKPRAQFCNGGEKAIGKQSREEAKEKERRKRGGKREGWCKARCRKGGKGGARRGVEREVQVQVRESGNLRQSEGFRAGGQKRSFCVRKIILKNITNIKSATRKSIGSGRRREAARGRGKTKKAEGKARKEGAGQKMIARRASGKGESSAKREIAVSL